MNVCGFICGHFYGDCIHDVLYICCCCAVYSFLITIPATADTIGFFMPTTRCQQWGNKSHASDFSRQTFEWQAHRLNDGVRKGGKGRTSEGALRGPSAFGGFH